MQTEDETLKRDKLLLDLMMHTYDEEVNRNELIDNKNSQMIVLTGVMLSLNATIFTEVLVNHILNSSIDFKFKLLTSSVLILSILLYIYSMTIFINAYAFQDTFYMCPESQFLLDKAINNQNEFETQGEILATMNDTIKDNYAVIQSKIDAGNKGFVWLKSLK